MVREFRLRDRPIAIGVDPPEDLVVLAVRDGVLSELVNRDDAVSVEVQAAERRGAAPIGSGPVGLRASAGGRGSGCQQEPEAQCFQGISSGHIVRPHGKTSH